MGGAWGLWACRLGYFCLFRSMFGTAIAAALFSIMIHRYCLIKIGQADDSSVNDDDKAGQAMSYEQASEEHFYTWFNTNPIHVLKSRHCDDIPAESSIPGNSKAYSPVPFCYGKEHLVSSNTDAHTMPSAGLSRRMARKLSM